MTPLKTHGIHAILLSIAAIAASAASARTVFDAGKALKANCAGSHANPWTDANDGRWQCDRADVSGVKKGDMPYYNGNFTHPNYGGQSGAVLAGFDNSGAQNQSVRVNISDTVTLANGEVVEADELVMFPGDTENQYAHLKFTIPSDGWYSAFVSAHDLVKGTAAANAGASVVLRAQGKQIVSGIVSLEDYSTASTRRFDFQMPVRYFNAGDVIDLLIGRNDPAGSNNNGANSGDNTGVKFLVTKEDEGAFYDSGIAMTNNLATAYSNPYGNTANGTWYYSHPTVPSGVDFADWAPQNFSAAAANLLSVQGTRSGADGERGFATGATATAPFAIVNEKDAADGAGIAPCELHAHPSASGWTTLRFRPPASGFYSGSVVVRDVNTNGDGVTVYLNVADRVVASAFVNAGVHTNSASLKFDSRLLAGGEPIDIVISPGASNNGDATALTAIFRREEGAVYDAAAAFAAQWAGGSTAHPFPDLAGGGATWDAGYNRSIADANYSLDGYATMPSAFDLAGTKLDWHVYAYTAEGNGGAPRITLASNGVASGDSYYVSAGGWYGTIPGEMFAQPHSPDTSRTCPTMRANVPEDGIYAVRGHARDLSAGANNAEPNGDGVRFDIAAGGNLAASVHVSADATKYGGTAVEAAIAAERLWLRTSTCLDAMIDPVAGNATDATGFGICYVKETAAIPGVVNIDITGSDGIGRFSAHEAAGREGFADWTCWNAMRYSSSVEVSKTDDYTIKNCREADGATRRNVAFRLKRENGSNIAKGWSPSDYIAPMMLSIWAKSENPSDVYTFTLSGLNPDEPYTLYLYSAKGLQADGTAVDGNAVFTVGGIAKSADATWGLRDAKTYARFDAVSDANGEISGTFAAGNADTSALATSLKGGAFCGLTLVGEFPEYVPGGMCVIIR